jgi:lysophospholipase L1-like esterase
VIALVVALMMMGEPPKVNQLRNADFSAGLTSWQTEGAARVDGSKLTLGPGRAVVRQRYDVPGLRILWASANFRPADKGRVRLECFDRRGKRWLSQTAAPDANGLAGIYLKTHAFTHHVVFSIEHEGEGLAEPFSAILQDDDRNRVEHAPQVDLDAAMEPIWEGNLVRDESVLLLGGRGKLLFAPTNVRSLRDSTLAKEYRVGKDFEVVGQEIRALAGSSIPTMSESEFATGEFPWTRLYGRHVFVTYEHADRWQGPVPTYQGDRLPISTSKRPLTVVAFGDSITLGINVSGYRNVPPYLPPWPDLLARRLGRTKLYNVALGGMTSAWARVQAREVVGSLRPDLVLVAFGMNDFWSLTPAQFRENLEGVMAEIRAVRPRCEFLLIAPMKFDPAYTADPTYVGNLAGYAEELRGLAGPGVGFVDMTELTAYLYAAKSAKDLGTDPMHPDDFLARWYAQAAAATLVKR